MPKHKKDTLKIILTFLVPFLVLVIIDFTIKLQSDPGTAIVRQSVVFFSIVFILTVAFACMIYLYNWNKILRVLELRVEEVRLILEEVESTLFKPSEANLAVGKYGLFFVLQVNRDAANYTIKSRPFRAPDPNQPQGAFFSTARTILEKNN